MNNQINVVSVAFLIIKKYSERIGYNPTAFVLQKLLYFTQIKYMQLNGGNLLFSENILCSTGGPCIAEIAEMFDGYSMISIDLPNEKINELAINDLGIEEIIVTVLNEQEDNLKNSVALGEKITGNPRSAWYLQKEQDNEVKKQIISIDFLIQEANLI